MTTPPLAFTVDQANAAFDAWRFNCGPGSLAAVLGVGPDVLRPHLLDFERKGYLNPSLMFDILHGLGLTWKKCESWPAFGLVRVQWNGPWCDPGRPMRARYRYTHWVACCRVGQRLAVFDVNAMYVGGWIEDVHWRGKLVPWILEECHPKAYGDWWATHILALDLDACLAKGREIAS